MAYTPVSKTVPQYHVSGSPASGYFLKGYDVGSLTAKSMATDSTGGTTLAKCQLNAQGYPINGSSAVFIPHFNGDFKLALYANATDADANTTANATWIVDSILEGLPNTTLYELGTEAAAASHPGISTGHLIKTNYHDSSRTSGSAGDFRFTGTTTAGNAGTWPHTGGYFYDADGKQFETMTHNVRVWGATGDGTTDDSSAINAALAYLDVIDDASLHFPWGVYECGTTTINWVSGVDAFFDNCVIQSSQTLDLPHNVVTVSSADNWHWSGHVTVKSTTTGATNETYGVYGLSPSYFSIQSIHLQNIARGIELDQAADFSLGRVGGSAIIGQLQSSTDTVSSVIVMNACARGTVDTVRGFGMQKAAVYLAISTGGGSGDNQDITIGQIEATSVTTSQTLGGALTIRSGQNITVGTVNHRAGYRACLIQLESGDTAGGHAISGVSIGQIIGKDVDDHTGSLGFAINSEDVNVSDTLDNAAAVDKSNGTVGVPITGHAFAAKDLVTIAGSTNYNGTYPIVSQTANEIVIPATYAAETFAGTETVTTNNLISGVTVGSIHIDGAAQKCVSIQDCENFNIGQVTALNVTDASNGLEGVEVQGSRFGKVDSVFVREVRTNGLRLNSCASVVCGEVQCIDLNRANSSHDAVRTDNCLDCYIDHVYAETVTTPAHQRALESNQDTTLQVGRVTSIASATTDIILANLTTFKGKDTRGYSGTAAPTAGTWAVGDVVYNSAPSVDGSNMVIDHWVCTVAGTPGTWVAQYLSTVSPAT